MLRFPEIKEPILHVFPYGSRVYGTATEKSDYDYIVVVDSNEDIKYDYEKENMNVHVYSESVFKVLIKRHDIAILECIFSKENDYEFNLDLERLRRSVSAVASNSFVKCKKKLLPGPDFNPYVGKKSLFHSIRILGEGVQIAEHGRIVDFGASNHYLAEIMDIDEWDELRARYEPVVKELRKKLKKLAPLDKDKRNKKW